VRVNDRGPYGKKSRIVDLSRAAAERLGMQKTGIAQVRVEVVGLPHKP
jgi:rare lipoprotein A